MGLVEWILVNDNPYFLEEAIKSFANKMKVHPGIVQGRFCFEQDSFQIKSSIDRTLF